MPPVTPQQPHSQGQPIPPAGAPAAGSNPLPGGFGNGIAQFQQQQVDQKLQTTETKYKRTKLLWFITLGALVITLALAVFFSLSLSRSRSANKSQYDDGYRAGDEARKLKDTEDTIRSGLSDTRTYTAPDELGGFSLAIPKSFSIATSSNGKDQLILLANPDKVGTAEKFLALRLTVRDELFAKVRDSYDRDAKSGGLKGPEDIQVDGRTAIRFVGKLDRRDKPGTVILVQVRDKTLIFQTDNNDDATLSGAFNAIITSARIP